MPGLPFLRNRVFGRTFQFKSAVWRDIGNGGPCKQAARRAGRKGQGVPSGMPPLPGPAMRQGLRHKGPLPGSGRRSDARQKSLHRLFHVLHLVPLRLDREGRERVGGLLGDKMRPVRRIGQGARLREGLPDEGACFRGSGQFQQEQAQGIPGRDGGDGRAGIGIVAGAGNNR